jgi:P-type Ca2+ transporter type 2C
MLLKFGSIAWTDMALAAGLGVILLVALEGCKPVVRRALQRSRTFAAPVSTAIAESDA